LADLAGLGFATSEPRGARRSTHSKKKASVPLADRPTMPSLESPAGSGPTSAAARALDELLGIGPEQRQAAAGQCQRAKEVLKAGNLEYGIHLLLSACKLDPVHTTYRQALRRAGKVLCKSTGRGSQSSLLPRLGNRTRLKAAKTTADHLKVLEDGERFLLESPGDIPIQLEMAGAAQVL